MPTEIRDQPGSFGTVTAVLVMLATPGQGAPAAADLSLSCDRAAMMAAQDTGVPAQALLAITRVETGRMQDGQVRPWPWTLNLGGRGYWLDSLDEAMDRAEIALAKGDRNFDVGCFQINHAWHGDRFDDLVAMLDPVANARYAAQFLASLRDQTGDWRSAVAAYHSRTPDLAEAYLAKYDAVLAGLDPGLQERLDRVAAAPIRENRYPLLGGTSDGYTSHGSLVPVGSTGTRGLFGG